MKFHVFDLGHKERGTVVVVSLSGNAANVRLMNSSNLSAYKSGRRHQYIGGLAKRSPVRLSIPSSGHWYVTVDMAGLKGSVRASVSIEPNALPPIKQAPMPSLTRIRHTEPPVLDDEGSAWDVFISHASEDKETVARPLATALGERGLKVWVDHLELKLGDSLRRRIDHGLSRSRFSVVVLSPAFFSKGWPQYELDGIVTLSVSGEQNMLPIWHQLTVDDVRAQSPSLADKLAISSSEFSISDMADQIAEVVLQPTRG